MPDQAARYVYTPLQPGEIRLLYSLVRGDEAVWSLKTVKVSSQGAAQEPLEFDALSYTWGDLAHTFPFLCSGQELRIHQNLKDALPYLARRDSSLPIWVDAVCINQSDDAEKFAQVRMMHTIYRRANQVWIWLGRGSEYAREAIALLPLVAKVGEELQNASNHITKLPTLESRGLPSMSSPIWDDMHELINNRWYCRLWVVQESALAKQVRVLYGREEVAWEALERAVDFGANMGYHIEDAEGRKPPRGFESNQNVFLIRDMVHNPERRVTTWAMHLLRTIVLTSRSHQCSQPRDRVLGVLGFVTEEQIEKIGLRDDLSVEDLYMKLTHFLLSEMRPDNQLWWDLLLLAMTSKKMPGLPSWCPNYHETSLLYNRLRDLQRPTARARAECPYHASKATGIPEQSSNIREITVLGKIFDTVRTVYPQVPDPDKWHEGKINSASEYIDMFLNMRSWERSIAASIFGVDSIGTLPSDPKLVSATTGDEVDMIFSLDDFWRILVGSITDRKEYTLTYDHYVAWRTALDRWATFLAKLDCDFDNKVLLNECAFGAEEEPELDDTDRETIGLLGPATPALVFLTDSVSILSGRCLFMTSAGRFGFGPDTTEEGDVVCVLNHAKTTHTLRSSQGANKEAFELLGQAYVHGMMNGEVESLGVEERNIVLI